MMSNYKRLLAGAAVVIGLMPALASAQQRVTVTGHVTSDAGAPVPGASVVATAYNMGASTDAEGRYSFTLPPARAGQRTSITARRIGYQPLTQQITLAAGTNTLDFKLVTAPTQLSGIVVTALGIEKEKKALGVAQQTIDSSMLVDNTKTTNVVATLSGKIAGIAVTTASSQGGSSRIVIRGANSIGGNNQPLFVVDGVPIDNSNFATSTQSVGGGGFDYGNTAQDINPDDIAAISVLKGPNAAALYGARAANGAIIITTKNGRGPGGFNVTASTNMSFDSPLLLPKYQNQWGQGYEGDICDTWHKGQTHFSAGAVPSGFDYATCGFSYLDGNYGGVNDGVDESWGPLLDGTMRSQYSTTVAGGADMRPWVAHPNNVSGFFQTGRTITSNVAAQGSNDRANYRMSFTRQDVAGMVPMNTLARMTGALAGGARISDKFNVDGNIQYIQNTGNNRPGTGYDESNTMMDFIWFGRQVDIAGFKNKYMDANGNQISWNYSYHNSPWWTQKQNHNGDQRDRVMGVASGTYKFNDWFKIAGRTGTDFYRQFNTYQFANGWIGGGFDGGDYSQGGFQESTTYQQETNSDVLATAKTNLLGDLALTVNAGGNIRVNRYRTSNFGTDMLVIPGIYNIGNSAKTVVPGESMSQKQINSAYGQAEFAYADYAFLNVTGRNDWSSTLPKGKNSYFYPSVSGSMVLTQAFPSLTGGFLTYGKLRGGWSRVGNDADPYRLIATFSSQSQFGSVSRFTTPNSLLNPGLKPENTDAWEVGAEMQAFDGRAGLDLTYYDKKTSNQIINASVSAASGYSSAYVNAGQISNKGIEAQVTLEPIRPSKPGAFGWDITLNYGKNKNNVDALYGNLQTVSLGGLWYLSVEARKGYAYGSMFGVGFLRDSASGQLSLKNGLPRPQPSTQKRVLGVYTPDWTGGIDNTFHFKGVDFGFLIDTRQGGSIYSVGNMWGMYSGVLAGTEFRPDTGIVIKGIDVATGQANTKHVRTEDYYHALYSIQERWIYDASFVKLREARMAFDIPQKLTEHARISKARLSLVGRNLALWGTHVPNIDPETSFYPGNVQGIEMGQMPTARSLGFQVTVTP